MPYVLVGPTFKSELDLKRILDQILKRWGYEYILVAVGVAVGLLVVLIVGFEEPPEHQSVRPVVTPPSYSAPTAVVSEQPPPTVPRRKAVAIPLETAPSPNRRPVLPETQGHL